MEDAAPRPVPGVVHDRVPDRSGCMLGAMNLKDSYIALAALFAALALLRVLFPGAEIVKEYVPNVLSEITGILLTVFLIDRVIRANSDKEIAGFRAIGFRQLRTPLHRMAHLLMNMYKASLAEPPNPPPAEIGELEEEDFCAAVSLLDFSRSAPVFPEMSWFDYLYHECAGFRAEVDGVIGKYGIHFGPEVVDLATKVKDSGFLSYLIQVKSVLAVDEKRGTRRTYNMLGGRGFDAMVKEFLADMTRMTELTNRNLPKEQAVSLRDFVWKDHVAPELGSGRIDAYRPAEP